MRQRALPSPSADAVPLKPTGWRWAKVCSFVKARGKPGQAIHSVLVEKAFGAAGDRVVIQEFLEGIEVSLHAICDGKTARLFRVHRITNALWTVTRA